MLRSGWNAVFAIGRTPPNQRDWRGSVACRSGWHDVVRTRSILTDIDDWKAVVEVRKNYCRAAKPVDTIMEVSRFVDPEWLVEVEVDAVVSHTD